MPEYLGKKEEKSRGVIEIAKNWYYTVLKLYEIKPNKRYWNFEQIPIDAEEDIEDFLGDVYGLTERDLIEDSELFGALAEFYRNRFLTFGAGLPEDWIDNDIRRIEIHLYNLFLAAKIEAVREENK